MSRVTQDVTKVHASVSGFNSVSSFGEDESIDRNSANTSKIAAIAPANIVRPHLLHLSIAIAGPRLENTTMRLTLGIALLFCSGPIAHAQIQPAPIDIPNAPVPIQVLVQSPADTNTDLQVICLFRSSPENTLHGSLLETNEKLKGLLDRVRNPKLFRGEFGETLLLAPPKGSLGAKKLLIIGLGTRRRFPRNGCNWSARSSIARPAVSAWRIRSSAPPSWMEESRSSPPGKSPNRSRADSCGRPPSIKSLGMRKHRLARAWPH
jgi:hypothetical protein